METMNRMSNMPPDSEAKDKVSLWLVTLGRNVCALYVVDLYVQHTLRQNMTSQETCSHTTQHLSSSRIPDTRQGESILSCCLCQTLTLPSKCRSPLILGEPAWFAASVLSLGHTVWSSAVIVHLCLEMLFCIAWLLFELLFPQSHLFTKRTFLFWALLCKL